MRKFRVKLEYEFSADDGAVDRETAIEAMWNMLEFLDASAEFQVEEVDDE